MGRKRNLNSLKEPVRIRFKKLANGVQSIYLDCYHDGKRQYEFLKLYLVPETDAATRERNRTTLAKAQAIKSQRIVALSGGGGLKVATSKSRMTLQQWMSTYYDDCEKRGRRGNKIIKNTAHALASYNPDTRMCDLSREYCLGLVEYLRGGYRTRWDKPLATFTAVSYLGCLRGALNAAVRADVITENPLNRLSAVEKIRMPESKRDYLTIDEVKLLADTPCKSDIAKRAFLFSCHCGLRISDIRALEWKDIAEDNGQWRISLVMRKTRTPLYLPLSRQAMHWLPERGNAADTDKVFAGMSKDQIINTHVKEWVKAAGIAKHVTYHASRHTHATMLLTLGADLYTVSKLLGHSKVETTQIYAKIVNKKKDDAVNLIDTCFAAPERTNL